MMTTEAKPYTLPDLTHAVDEYKHALQVFIDAEHRLSTEQSKLNQIKSELATAKEKLVHLEKTVFKIAREVSK